MLNHVSSALLEIMIVVAVAVGVGGAADAPVQVMEESPAWG